MIAHTSIGGRRVRIELSNVFGSTPLIIGSAHIALRDKESAIVAASDRTLRFGGQPSFWIPAGATVISDAVNMDVPASSDLAVSIYIPETGAADTLHAVGLHTTYISKEGNATAQIGDRGRHHHAVLLLADQYRCGRASGCGGDRHFWRFHHRWRGVDAQYRS